jgi:hypothetical protein
MPSTFTPLLRLTKPGLNDTGWGTTVNNGTFELIDNSIAGLVSVDVTSGNATLTTANGATDQARYMFIRAFGASVARDVVVPATSKLYFVINDCTAAVTFKVSGQTGVTVPGGKTAVLRCDGTDVVAAVTHLTALSVDGDLGVGTSSPGYKLDIQGASGVGIQIYETSTGFNNRLRITQDAGLATYDTTYTSSSTNAHVWKIAAFEYMRLDASGNLGIGTSSPAYKLVVSSNGASGIEFGPAFSGTANLIQSYNRSGSAYVNTVYDAASHIYQVSGTEHMRLDASGNLGLGVTPSAWASGYAALQMKSGGASLWSDGTQRFFLSANVYYNGTNRIYQTTGVASEYIQNGGAHSWYTAPSGTAGNPISFTQAMTLDANGNLLVGTTSTTLVGGRASKVNVVQDAIGTWAGGFIHTTSNSAEPFGIAVFYSNAAPNNVQNPFLYLVDNAALRAEIRSNGGLANYSGNDVNLSDRREKTNFAPAKAYLDTICAIPVQTFNYIDQSEDDPGLTLGVVAQDVQAVAPELVMESNWGTKDNPKMRLSIYQTDLQYALMKCIQELKAELDQTKARLVALESK